MQLKKIIIDEPDNEMFNNAGIKSLDDSTLETAYSSLTLHVAGKFLKMQETLFKLNIYNVSNMPFNKQDVLKYKRFFNIKDFLKHHLRM